MDTLTFDVVRARPPAVLIRADDQGRDVMTGHFSTFGDWYEVDSWFEGNFLEAIAPGAFRQTIKEDRADVKVTFNHGFDVLGDQVLGPISELREDDTGPYYEVPLFRGVPDLLREGLREGVYGSSFRFQVLADSWDEEPEPSESNPRGIKQRTITKVRLMEFGPVTFPANPNATAGLRSLTDRYYEQLKRRDTSAYEAAVRAAKKISTEASSARSTDGGDTDLEPGNGDGSTPTTRHPQDPSRRPYTPLPVGFLRALKENL
jgi:HK97 family phage prohead protease